MARRIATDTQAPGRHGRSGAAGAAGEGLDKFQADGITDLKGKVVLIDFWATWCGPCMAAVPHNNEMMEKYGGKGLVIIGVCIKNGADKFAATVKEKGMKDPVAVDADGKTEKAYHVDGYPDYYLIDRAGKLRIAD